MRVILSGCSGGGKTTLLEELARCGYATVPEPGLRIVRAAQAGGAGALPWIDPEAFARRALAMAQADLAATADSAEPVFFDRGLIDAIAALEHATGSALPGAYPPIGQFHQTVFMVPPWPEQLHPSADRRGTLDEAVAEYERLLAIYARLGFTAEVIPQLPVAARAQLVLARLGLG